MGKVVNFIWIMLLLSNMFGTYLCSDEEKASNRVMDGKYLLEIGRKLRNPLLRLIGKTFISMECQYHSCPWSQWSRCSATVPGEFGTSSRSRVCRPKSLLCKQVGKSVAQTESKLCESFCPKHYNFTKNDRFCFKISTTKVDYSTARASCNKDKGHLININSHLKLEHLHNLLETDNKLEERIWIDGTRKDVSSPWEYSYEANTDNILDWHPGQPTNGNSELCLEELFHTATNVRVKNDKPCSYKFYFVCEVTP